MYLYQGGDALVPITSLDDWYARAIRVFEGDFTVGADKLRLVNVVLGLWARVVQKRNEPAMRRLYDEVCAARDAVFPAAHFRELPQMLEASVLGQTQSDKLSVAAWPRPSFEHTIAKRRAKRDADGVVEVRV